VLAVDALMDKNGRLAQLSPETLERLNAVLPATWSRANPVDIIGDAPGERYIEALSALLQDPQVDGILVLNCPTAVVSSTEAAQAVIDCINANKVKAGSRGVFTCWLGDGQEAQTARRMFNQHRIATYHTPDNGVRAFMQTYRYRHSQELLMETPPNIPEAFTPDSGMVRGIIERALAEKREWLDEVESKQVLAAYAIDVVPTRTAASPQEVGAISAEIEGAVAVKIISPHITHKSDVGGVALALRTADDAQTAAAAMLERIAQLRPGANLEGFSVQPMIQRPDAHELIVGITEDPQFGPVILFGQGGTAVELIQDQALTLPPLNMLLAREVIDATKISRLLEGYRGRPAADLTAIALTLVKISHLTCDFAEICDLDINPLLADEQGVMALDARIRVKAPPRPGVARLAIRPYPKELEEEIHLPGDQILKLRPIRPEDEPALQAIFERLSPEEIRLRFLHPMKVMSHEFAARLTQINYDREMALVLMDETHRPRPILCGTVRLAADPNGERAEFAILIHGDMTGMGLGPLMMRRLIDYAQSRGIGELYGEVLMENRNMLKLCRSLGFTVKRSPDEPGVMHVVLKL
ncbi:MAG: GNAT family N-acetyltransferase, partial [Desulfobacterales bacterium]